MAEQFGFALVGCGMIARYHARAIAEIPGTDPALKDEVVMVGAHLDSWHSGTGATDNGAGSASELGVQDAVDVSIATLSKAIGCVGGAACGSRDLLRVANAGRAWHNPALSPSGGAARPSRRAGS